MTTPATPRLPIANAHQMTLKLNQGGQTAAIVLGAKGAGAWGSQTEANAWANQVWEVLREGVSSSVQCVGAVVRDTDGDGLGVYEVGAISNPAGTVTGAIAPAAASALIRWSTTQGGRSGKGRTFLPGMVASWVDTDGRTFAAAGRSYLQARINGYLAIPLYASGTLTPAVLSFKRGQAYSITGGAVSSIIGIQRRRMRG